MKKSILEINNCVICGRTISPDRFPHYCEYYIRQLNLFGYRALDELNTSIMMNEGDE